MTVVVAAENYPGPPVTGDVITGADADGVLHAGTRRADDGTVVSAGGRVLSVVGHRRRPDRGPGDGRTHWSAGSGCAARTTAPTSRRRGGGPGPGARHRLT